MCDCHDYDLNAPMPFIDITFYTKIMGKLDRESLPPQLPHSRPRHPPK